MLVYPRFRTTKYYNLDREILQCTTIGRSTRSTSFLAAKIFNILNIIKLVKGN